MRNEAIKIHIHWPYWAGRRAERQLQEANRREEERPRLPCRKD